MGPFRFKPLLKQTLWGGDKIAAFKHLDTTLGNVGESWELSGIRGSETVVSEGEYAGMSLSELVGLLKEQLVGKDNYERYGNNFPLLIKFIDAREPLSIQVHPNDEVAQRQGMERGKTEMWYVMKSDPDASLMAGLNRHITPEEYRQMVASDTITEAIARYPVKENDCFFLPAGRIHSIGKGCFLAEIQQASDVTYRIYDFKRKDKNGNCRELHTEQAAESIDFHVESSYRTFYVPAKDEGVALVRCRYFHTYVYDLTKPTTVNLRELDSFVIVIMVSGQGTITDADGHAEQVKAGETLLFPATTQAFRTEGQMKFLLIYA